MNKNEVTYSLEKLEKAIVRLDEAVERARTEDELIQDGAIQRFEFTFELLWKTLKVYFEFLGKNFSSPREVLKEAFRIGLITDEQTFLTMLTDRNICSHVYDFETTRKIFSQIDSKYLKGIKNLAQGLKKAMKEK